VPMDPKNSRYQLVNGRVQVAHPDLFPFITKGLPPEREPGDLPDDPGYRLSKDTE